MHPLALIIIASVRKWAVFKNIFVSPSAVFKSLSFEGRSWKSSNPFSLRISDSKFLKCTASEFELGVAFWLLSMDLIEAFRIYLRPSDRLARLGWCWRSAFRSLFELIMSRLIVPRPNSSIWWYCNHHPYNGRSQWPPSQILISSYFPDPSLRLYQVRWEMEKSCNLHLSTFLLRSIFEVELAGLLLPDTQDAKMVGYLLIPILYNHTQIT